MTAAAGAANGVEAPKVEPKESARVVPHDEFLPSQRNLLLSAAGTKEPQPGQVRIPIPVDGQLYEIIVAKPGEPRVVPVATR
jgi:hypothetical protein